MLSRLFKARSTRAAVAVALVATAFAFTAGSPTSAAPQTKSLTGSCAGADDASRGLLAAFGGALALPFTITSDVPATLDPEAPDQPISFTWGITIAASVTSQIAAIDPTLTVKDLSLDMGISGPTDTTEVQGRPGPVDIAITGGQPATVTQGPFTGTLEGIGKGGIIKYSPKKIALTISLDISGKTTDVKVECSAPGTAATTSIKIPGSPDVVQPIELEGTANSSVSVDVLGKYVTDGTDENGVKRPVQPETLKVVEGPGQVVNGQVVVNTGAAGTTSSVTFEVCSGTLPGTNEVQTLQIDPTGEAFKKGVALTVKLGDEVSPLIWLVPALWRGTTPTPQNWLNTANDYILRPHELPSPADVQAALEALPSIGGGGVKVTAGDKAGLYNIEFVGKNGEKDIDSLAIDRYYSVFPQEVLTGIIDAAKGLLGGGAGGGPTTTLPGGAATVDEAIAWVDLQIAIEDAKGIFRDWTRWGDLQVQRLDLMIKKGLSDIDVNAAITALTGLFSTPPQAATLTAGEDPIGICSQGVIDVSVAAASVEGASTGATGTAGTSGGSSVAGASLSLAG
ncbi:hypothetical protein [Dermatobacter hominis]|uniref:hypothetical protein n=1 Tax=Dermatobacter hominis TaxID=2884263 RepID=UPI001D126951|nr:hypothetical protein [Dermatobacter hominis]UDY34832.1 hypothetical protein LH044_16000 [Dermatobacter hominis]